MEPKQFVEKANSFITILKETTSLLEQEEKVKNMRLNETCVAQHTEKKGVDMSQPGKLLGLWLDWASDHMGTLAIELDQNLNPSLYGDEDPNTGEPFSLEF